jgi:hypothetical protein
MRKKKFRSPRPEGGPGEGCPTSEIFQSPPAISSASEEAERLIDAAEPEWRALLLVVLKSGLRQG